MFRRSGMKSNYAYMSAKVKAKKSNLLTEEDYNKMLMMSVPEICHYIGESGYQQDMTELGAYFKGLDLLEYATYLNMARIFNDLVKASQGELRDMVTAYLKKWDYWNLKVILRGKSYGLSTKEIQQNLIPAGGLSADSLDRIGSIESEEALISAFAASNHIEIPADVLSLYRADKNLAALEDYLDGRYYTDLLASINKDSTPTRLFNNYVRYEVDMINMETILKLKLEDIPADAIMGYFVPGGKDIDEKTAANLAALENVDAVVNELATIEGYEEIKEIFVPGTNTIAKISMALKKFHRQQALKFSHLYPLSVLPVVDYLINKEIEVSNIRTIARGTQSGLDRETIKELLVI